MRIAIDERNRRLLVATHNHEGMATLAGIPVGVATDDVRPRLLAARATMPAPGTPNRLAKLRTWAIAAMRAGGAS